MIRGKNAEVLLCITIDKFDQTGLDISLNQSGRQTQQVVSEQKCFEQREPVQHLKSMAIG